MNSFAANSTTLRPYIPIVENLKIACLPGQDDLISLSIGVRKARVELFERKFAGISEFRMIQPRGVIEHCGPDTDFKIYTVSVKLIDKCLLNFLNESFGKRIEKVWLEECRRCEVLGAISIILQDISFPDMEIFTKTMSENQANHLDKFLNEHNVVQIVLRIGEVSRSAQVNFRLRLSTFVPNLKFARNTTFEFYKD